MILETSKVKKYSMGSKESVEGQGRPLTCDLPCVVKSIVIGSVLCVPWPSAKALD